VARMEDMRDAKSVLVARPERNYKTQK